MKMKKVWQPMALSMAATMLIAFPAAAEEAKPDLKTALEQAGETTVAEQNTAETTSAANTTGMPETEAAAPAAAQVPYLGETVTKVTLSGDGKYDKDRIIEALTITAGTELTQEGLTADLKTIYEIGYFYDVRPEYIKVPEGVQIVYHVMENPIYKGLELEGNTKMSSQEIEKIFDIPTDSALNTKDINDRVKKLEAEYHKNGYILMRVADVRLLPSGKLAVVVNEGIVEDFKVKGNSKTKDRVIIREMKLKKGEPFNAKDARRSMQKIYNLGYFEDVNIKLNPGQQPNAVDVEITVVEMNTGSFGIGAGYSDADGFLGMVSIGDKNFRGIGDKINLRWEFGGGDGSNNKNYEFSYTRPWLDDKETAVGLTIYDMTNEYADYNRDGDEIARYDKQRRGQEITFSRKTNNEYVNNYLTLKNRDDIYDKAVDDYNDQYYEGSDIKDPSLRPAVRAERLKENFGLTRSIAFARVFDSRDNIYDPHEGKRTSYAIEYAGLGGDFDFTKLSADYRYYYKMGPENVLALNFAVGYADGTMPLSQRFAVGGSETLRGYKDDQFKGNSMLRGTVEYRMPLMKKVQGVLFTDYGYAWDKKTEDKFDFGLMKLGYGVGLRVNSPLGPLRLDYGFGDEGGRFHFSFGGQF